MGQSRHRLIDGAPTESDQVEVVPRVGTVRHVALVEPDTRLRQMITDALEGDGCHVSSVCDAEELLALITHHRPDLVITEFELPSLSGLELVRRLFSYGRLPTIVLASGFSETDLVVTLEMGADDYIEKPFTHRELLARVHAVLRRIEHCTDCESLRFEGLSIDFTTREVVVGDRPVELTALEFDLLAFMASSPRQAFSRETLLDRVWGSSGEWQTTSTVSEHIHRLRRKIEADPSAPRWLQTMRGVGYRFVP
jgi:DNA-binding response OmpR family regulator